MSEQFRPSDRVALSLQALGAAGHAWLDGLPDLLAGLATDWSITVGGRLDGGRAAYVAEVTTQDGTPAVLKVAIPSSDFERQLTALQLAGGDPYAGLISYDVRRRALLLERLGPPMASLGWNAPRQLAALTRTAARGWRPVPEHVRLPTWTEAARWHASFIPETWEALGRPCSEATVDMAVRYATEREAAFRPGEAVLVHGDVHALNTLRGAGSTFRLVDPTGLISEPAHDLGVIQARGVRARLDELAAAGGRKALAQMTGSCRQAVRITGTDPDAIWQWAFTEMVSTGLHLLRLGDHEEASPFLSVTDTLAANTPFTRTRTAGPATPPRKAGEPAPADLLLMVGLPAAGKTTRAAELAAEHRALRLTPDEWMISLYDGTQPDGKRDLLEGRLITLALQALRLGTNVVLDFGLWSRDERSALRWLAAAAGATCQVIYLPLDEDEQRARIAHRQATAAHTTFPMSEADVAFWRTQFEAPETAELEGADQPEPPPGWPGWPEWAADRWPSLSPGPRSGS